MENIMKGILVFAVVILHFKRTRPPHFFFVAIISLALKNFANMAVSDKDPREEVLQAWYMDDSDEDQRLPHHKNPKEFVSLDKLAELGVLSWRLDADNYETDEELKKIREDRGYSYMDFCEVCPEKLPNYEEKIKNFFEEHLHTDEEIRYAVAGSGYFDVRDGNEKWIRIWVKKGGMIVLPAGCYHRFTLDTDNYIKDPRVLQACYKDDSDEDQRLPHHKNPKESMSLDKLAELEDLSRRYVYIVQPHNNPMVITVQIANCQVHCVLIDTGSSVDILFKGALERFNLKNPLYNSCTTPLYGFTGHSVMPIGSMTLPVLIGEAHLQQNIMTNFVVVDIPSAFSAILGRPFLSEISGVLSIRENVLKFPVGNEWGEVRGDQQAARKCFAVSTNPTALAKQCAHVTNVPSGGLPEKDHESLGEVEVPDIIEEEDQGARYFSDAETKKTDEELKKIHEDPGYSYVVCHIKGQ